MLKAKATVEIEVDQDKIPPDWQQDLNKCSRIKER